jgi:hypothetical protein
VGVEELDEGDTRATVWPLEEEAGGIIVQVLGTSDSPERKSNSWTYFLPKMKCTPLSANLTGLPPCQPRTSTSPT